MMKNGIALIITLGIIAIITAIVLNSITLIDKSFQQTSKVQSLIQNQLILTHMQKALNQLSSEITEPAALQAMMGEFPGLSDDDGKFILGFSLRPAQAKTNINGIFNEDNKTLNPAYKELLFTILNLHEVLSPDQMIALIADTIDLDTVDRSSETERINLEVDFSNGAIKSFDLLYKLSQTYAKELKDPNIMQVKWEEYFFLGPLFTPTTLDCDFLSWELAKVLQLRVEATQGLDQISCDALSSDQNVTLKSYNIVPFKKGSPYFIEVEADFETQNSKGKFKALYDLDSKRMRDIRTFNTL